MEGPSVKGDGTLDMKGGKRNNGTRMVKWGGGQEGQVEERIWVRLN